MKALRDAMTEWMEDAACKGRTDLDWFPESGRGYGHAYRAQIGPAIRLCCNCPMQTECLNAALSEPDDHGIRGGLTAAQRRRMRQASRRTNRRKAS